MTPLIRSLAELYRDAPEWDIRYLDIVAFRDDVEHYYDKIPMPIRYLMDLEHQQPFHTSEAMHEHCVRHGELLMLSQDSKALGRNLYHKHRTVHDWFGHIKSGDCFGAEGEIAAFRSTAAMYSARSLPIVFSDVVLANCYAECFPDEPMGEKWVLAPDFVIQSFLKGQ